MMPDAYSFLSGTSAIGFTGTPIESTDVNTPAVFGNYVDVYDIAQAVEDGATVRIYYESRLAKVNLSEEGKQLMQQATLRELAVVLTERVRQNAVWWSPGSLTWALPLFLLDARRNARGVAGATTKRSNAAARRKRGEVVEEPGDLHTRIDWTIKESVKAKLKVIVKRTLRHFGYPPDMQKLATDLVLRQAEMLAGEFSEG